jgi:hypothetical protein
MPKIDGFELLELLSETMPELLERIATQRQTVAAEAWPPIPR